MLTVLKNCNVNEIDFETTLEILAIGLQELGRIMEPGEITVHLFSVEGNIIKASFTDTTKLDMLLNPLSQVLLKMLIKKVVHLGIPSLQHCQSGEHGFKDIHRGALADL